MNIEKPLQSVLKQKLSLHFSPVGDLSFQAVGGGSINQSYRISFSGEAVFCKINSASKLPDLFLKEKAGLELIKDKGIIKTPSVIDCFEFDDKQILFLEWIKEGARTEAFWKKFGEQLAALHRCSNEYFGLHDDNYMGSVEQMNTPSKDWNKFFAQQRLLPMIERCISKGLLKSQDEAAFHKLISFLPQLFEKENPSLLHGDLWSGNFMCNEHNEPVLIDPAVYHGHRSMDLAMTTLFGGFRQPFYDSYNYHFPLPVNYEEQWAVCNLYPLLIHLYLFGNSYLPQIENTLRKFS